MSKDINFTFGKLHLSYEHESYEVTERGVTCTIGFHLHIDGKTENCITILPKNALKKICNKYEFGNNDGYFTVTSTAKCHTNDAFDEIRGRHIAQSRCKKKGFDKAARFINDCLDYYEQVVRQGILDNLGYYATLIDDEQDHIDDLTSGK